MGGKVKLTCVAAVIRSKLSYKLNKLSNRNKRILKNAK